MKVKPWHIGCIIVLIAAALYFLVGMREGLDNPACPADAPGITSVKQSGGQNIRLYTTGECSALGGKFTGNGAKNWGMANDTVGECMGTTNGINVGFCNQSAPPSAAAQSSVNPATPPSSPMPPGHTGTAGGASMDSKLPVPASMPPSYTLTCNASPVSGMVGSVTGSDGVAPWNISQPSPGWNSKHGYTTTGN